MYGGMQTTDAHCASARSLRSIAIAAALLALAACKDDKPKDGDTPPPPPPPVSAAPKGACASGGGTVDDPVSAPFFPRATGGYCVDPQAPVKTYGDRGKLTMDEVCTTAFDGECEVYKRLGLKRVVALRYIDGSGKGGTVDVNLSEFADAQGAYAMFTSRIVAGDPADPSTPKVLHAGTAGAIGTGRAYVWRDTHLAELQYNNEVESPEQLAKSSEAILTVLGRDLGAKLPGSADPLPEVKALPAAARIPGGTLFHPKDALGVSGAGAAAYGFYKEGDKRWRVMSMVRKDVDQAKDAFKAIKSKPGAMPVPQLGDEACHVVLAPQGAGPKVEWLVVRKGNAVWGVGDEEHALRDAAGNPDAEKKARVSKEDAIAKMKELLAGPAPTVPSPSATVPPAVSAAVSAMGAAVRRPAAPGASASASPK